MNLFEVKITFEKEVEEGLKKVTECYMFDADSFSSAEYSVIEEIGQYIKGDYLIKDIKRSNVIELVAGEGDYWFNIKLNFITLDEKSAKEKKQAAHYLVKANTVAEANNRLNEFMKGSLCDYSIESVTETKILEVYK